MSDTNNIYDAIVAADEKFMTTFNSGDVEGLAALYTENGQFMPPNSDFVTGRQAIQATFQAIMDMGVKTIRLEALEVEGYGDTASEVGTYALENENGEVMDKGKFLVIWKQESGQWKLHRDMINSSIPAPV